jgi:hypothetical protein
LKRTSCGGGGAAAFTGSGAAGFAVGCAGLAVDGFAVDGFAVEGFAVEGAGFCVWATAGSGASDSDRASVKVQKRGEREHSFM